MRPIDADLLEKQLLELAGDNPPMFHYFSGAIGVIRKQPTISALERQIPKKVKYEDVGYDNYLNVNCFSCICPNCELHIIDFNDTDVLDEYSGDDIEKMFHSSMVHHAYIGLNSYCNRCGQKLDWSDEV